MLTTQGSTSRLFGFGYQQWVRDIELGTGAEFVGCAELVGKHIHDVELVQVSKLQRIVSSCCGVEFYFHLYYVSIF